MTHRSKRTTRMSLLLTPEQRQMLEWLAQVQRRSMNDVIGLAIERIYQVEQNREAKMKAGGVSRASAIGAAIKPR